MTNSHRMQEFSGRIARRRWYQFSLRTMFVLVTLACVVLAWVGYSLNWIRERRAILRTNAMDVSDWIGILIPNGRPVERPRAPGGLWLFGEKGVTEIQSGASSVEHVRRLFPEAVVVPLLSDFTPSAPGMKPPK